eukprot:gene12432-biopygen5076
MQAPQGGAQLDFNVRAADATPQCSIRGGDKDGLPLFPFTATAVIVEFRLPGRVGVAILPFIKFMFQVVPFPVPEFGVTV